MHDDHAERNDRPDPIMDYLEETEDVVAMVLAVITTLIQIQKTMDQLIPVQQEGVEGDLTPQYIGVMFSSIALTLFLLRIFQAC